MSDYAGQAPRALPVLDFSRSHMWGGPQLLARLPETTMVFDIPNMCRAWLQEAVSRKGMTQEEADQKIDQWEGQTKLGGGIARDGVVDSVALHRMAKDFGRWYGARVSFTKNSAGHELVIFKGWPARRGLVRGTRYRLDNPLMVKLQVGEHGLEAAAKASFRFNVILVMTVDVGNYILRSDRVTFGQLLGSLSVDIVSIQVAGAVADAALPALVAAGFTTVGAITVGPVAVAFIVGVGVAAALFAVDEQFGLSARLDQMYDQCLADLGAVWKVLGDQAPARYRQLVNSNLVHDLRQDVRSLARKIGRHPDLVRSQPAILW